MQKTIDVHQQLTPEQLAMLKAAASVPTSTDDAYPEFSEEELLQFRRISSERKASRNKQTVTLRLSPQALEKARSLGKGYTTILSRILENALANPEMIERNL
jgi:uncharacterized protein (DUF4415 family)